MAQQFYEFPNQQAGAQAYALFLKDNPRYTDVLSQTTPSGQLQALATSGYSAGGYSNLEQIYQDIKTGSISVSPNIAQLANQASSTTGLDPTVVEAQWQAENGGNGALSSTANWSKFYNNVGNIAYSPSTAALPSMQGIDAIATKQVHEGATYFQTYSANGSSGLSITTPQTAGQVTPTNVSPYSGIAGIAFTLDQKLNGKASIPFIGLPYSALWRFLFIALGMVILLITIGTNRSVQQLAITGAMMA